jgi:hypothetical protein
MRPEVDIVDYLCVAQRWDTGTPCRLLANGTTSVPA